MAIDMISDVDTSGALRQAELAGLNSAITGADTVFDLLSRTLLLVDHALAIDLGRGMVAWRQQLAEATSGQAVYLGVALAGWAQAHRRSDLREDVVFELHGGDGAVVLSSFQHRRLLEELDRLPLRGVTAVRARQRASGIRLRFGSIRLWLPASGEAWEGEAAPGPALIESMWRRGRTDALELMVSTVKIAEKRFAEQGHTVDAELASEIGARLADLDARLAALRC